MSDREALAAALDAVRQVDESRLLPLTEMGRLIFTAARERLAQLPELVDDPECGDCDHLPRKLYPAELVQRIADAIHEEYDTNGGYHAQAIAALDALNGETT